ncbi:MAG: thiamine diphosphokinase [Christensenellales bacterium]
MLKECFIALNSDSVSQPFGDLICADGGYDKVKGYGVKPVVVIGDFDSSKERDVENAIRYPSEKNYSDGELCLEYAIENGYKKAVFSGVTGGRLDHQLANLSLIKKSAENGIDAMAIDNVNGKTLEIFYAASNIEFAAQCGDLISVMPFNSVTCLKAYGVKYPLDNLTIKSDDLSRGMSNVATDETVKFEITDGEAFIFHYKK